MSLAQNSGRSDLIPLWCQAPADVRPPPPSPPPRSEAVLFEDLEATEGSEKKKKEKKKKKKNKKERVIETETETVAPAVASTSTADTEPPPEQAPLASQPEDQWLLSMTDRMSQFGTTFKVPEGWENYNEEEFNFFVTDALAAVGINQSQLPEGWIPVIRRKARKRTRTLPNVPEFLSGTMYNYPRVEEPEDQWEWELSIHARIQNLTSDGTFEVLEILPPIPINPIVAEWVPQDVPDDDDDDGWNREMHRCLSNLQSGSEISMKRDEEGHPVIASLPVLGLKESKEVGLPDIGGLPELPSISGLPDFSSLPSLPELPKLPDDFDRDIEERFGNLLTDTSCANDDALASGGVPNLGIEVNRNDIPQLDLDNVPGAVPPCGVGARKKEAKKIQKEAKKKSKKVKKQLKKEADRHDAVAKKKKEKAQELRQSIDYCERKPEALQFAIDVNKKQPIEKEQCHTEDTEEEERKEEKKNQYLLVCRSNDGCNYDGYKKKAMKKQSVTQKPKERLGMLQIPFLFNRVLQREDSLV